MPSAKHICLGIVATLTSLSCNAQNKNGYISVNHVKEINVNDNNYISSVDGGALFRVFNFFYVGGGASICKVWAPEYSALGAGAGPDVHIYALKKQKFKLFLEGKGRVTYLFPEYPESALNFAFWGGPTVEFSLSERNKLKVGICYHHLSNGKRHEQNENRSLDGVGLMLGWAFW